eukprot:CAMPEP_0115842730 /NCGR_PEP_ID=MMETSP0287-20121206/7949_1 /TAXON_ID=412157 /ORGANISM="Chrysochromulina rotalis, Strain UIO044" /LENGTH=173 /DNA_ID=CAMNT_0003296405 /DNA_START=567 /DNA_END=1087 /DNA_ORIENTATION=-
MAISCSAGTGTLASGSLIMAESSAEPLLETRLVQKDQTRLGVCRPSAVASKREVRQLADGSTLAVFANAPTATVFADAAPPPMSANASAAALLARGALPPMQANTTATARLTGAALPAMLADAASTALLAEAAPPAVLALARSALALACLPFHPVGAEVEVEQPTVLANYRAD